MCEVVVRNFVLSWLVVLVLVLVCFVDVSVLISFLFDCFRVLRIFLCLNIFIDRLIKLLSEVIKVYFLAVYICVGLICL